MINRKFYTAALVCATIVSAGTLRTAHGQEPKDILFYGNSFTNGNNVPNMVRSIASAAGHPTPRVVNAAVDGQSLHWHLNSVTQMQRIGTQIAPGGQWENVVLQDFSTLPTHIGNLSQHLSGSLGVYQRVAAHSPNVVPVLYQTWARGYGDSLYAGGSPAFPGGPTQMQAELRDGYQMAADNIDSVVGSSLVKVAPAGDAWELANFPRNFYGSDVTYHASNRGSFLNSLILYGTIYDDFTTSDINLAGIQTSLGLSAADIAQLTALADSVLAPVAVVPEPATATLVLVSLAIAFGARRSRRHTALTA